MAASTYARDGQSSTGSAWPNVKKEKITAPRSSDLIQLEAQFNALLARQSAAFAILGGDGPITTSTPSTGTTNTVACSASTICIAGVPVVVAAETAKAFGSLGTIPASTWGLIVLERVAAGTTTFVSAAANYTTGYATEALAIAAMPAKSANKAVVGYLTIKASASTWIAGTDGLALGSGGNVATTTNFYSVYGVTDLSFWSNYAIGNKAGTIVTTANSYLSLIHI